MVIPMTVGLTREDMIATLHDWVVTNCDFFLNHHVMRQSTKATLLHVQVALEEH